MTGALEALLKAIIRAAWNSLHSRPRRPPTARPPESRNTTAAHMAVVVQRMVDAEVAGVLFTANPVTGSSEGEAVVDAAPGLGTAVVDGRRPLRTTTCWTARSGCPLWLPHPGPAQRASRVSA